MTGTILIVAAFILFLLAAFGVGTNRVNLVAAGLACWSLAQLLGRVALVFAVVVLCVGCTTVTAPDGTKTSSFAPAAEDYKLLRELGRR